MNGLDDTKTRMAPQIQIQRGRSLLLAGTEVLKGQPKAQRPPLLAETRSWSSSRLTHSKTDSNNTPSAKNLVRSVSFTCQNDGQRSSRNCSSSRVRSVSFTKDSQLSSTSSRNSSSCRGDDSSINHKGSTRNVMSSRKGNTRSVAVPNLAPVTDLSVSTTPPIANTTISTIIPQTKTLSIPPTSPTITKKKTVVQRLDIGVDLETASGYGDSPVHRKVSLALTPLLLFSFSLSCFLLCDIAGLTVFISVFLRVW